MASWLFVLVGTHESSELLPLPHLSLIFALIHCYFVFLFALVAIFFGAIERFLYRSNSPTSKNFSTVLTCECANITNTKHNTI